VAELFITESNRDYAHQWLDEQLADGKPKRLTVKNTRRRTTSQNSLQHMWYSQISKYLISKGRTNWDSDYVKMNLKNTFLGSKAKTMTDVNTGEVTTQWVPVSTSTLDLGAAQYYMEQIEQWAASLDIVLTIPNDSEFYINRGVSDGKDN
tara:strand:+ start:464 stop:913 length:450 start_codon:yes stop_codon:yes gene_type:complete